VPEPVALEVSVTLPESVGVREGVCVPFAFHPEVGLMLLLTLALLVREGETLPLREMVAEAQVERVGRGLEEWLAVMVLEEECGALRDTVGQEVGVFDTEVEAVGVRVEVEEAVEVVEPV
jgi:hypothetical protein